ncbi:hypothetical protein Ciccas_013838 [Cichlidogyrus casuarinus]|uniref:Uncharacterized protein n=1 Tax=Cichlidogyrus casuarinus TaxID=1844966 RepID=A0ABD2PJI9_9PLAT
MAFSLAKCLLLLCALFALVLLTQADTEDEPVRRSFWSYLWDKFKASMASYLEDIRRTLHFLRGNPIELSICSSSFFFSPRRRSSQCWTMCSMPPIINFQSEIRPRRSTRLVELDESTALQTATTTAKNPNITFMSE